MLKPFLMAPKNIKIICILCVICQAFIFTQPSAADTLSGSSTIPERKKGTLLFEGRSADRVKQPPVELYAEDAKLYRIQGLEAQKRGEFGLAYTYYQKAIELYPGYAVVYNDMGVVCEARGETGRAEENYLKAIKIDPGYLSPYSNLALLYENKRDFRNASLYWQKRALLGSPNDAWTKRARARYNAICMTIGDRPLDAREQEVVSFTDEISQQKTLAKRNSQALADYHFGKAKNNLYSGDDVVALKEAITANQLDPGNDSINDFIERLQKRLLTK